MQCSILFRDLFTKSYVITTHIVAYCIKLNLIQYNILKILSNNY